MKHKLFIFMLIVVFVLGWWLHLSGIEKGERLAVDNCGGCHDLSAGKENQRGPYLWGIVDRRAGIADGFTYSEAFRKFVDTRQFYWTEINLDMLITDPDKLIPGTKMAERESDSQHAKAFENMQNLDHRRELDRLSENSEIICTLTYCIGFVTMSLLELPSPMAAMPDFTPPCSE